MWSSSQYSKAELQNTIIELREKGAPLYDEHGASDADELATDRAIDDDSWTDVSRMRDLEENLDIAKVALNRFDFDPDGSGPIAADA